MRQNDFIFLLGLMFFLFFPQSKADSLKTIQLAKIKLSQRKKAHVLNDTLAFSKDFLLGKINYKKHPDFVLVAAKHSSKAIYMQRVVYDAFIKMEEAARKEGVNLLIISGTRNFWEQKVIWERKWNLAKWAELTPEKRALNILHWSSMPMTSRHHWGTDMDINSLENSYFEKTKGKKEYEWLKKNAARFGFCQVYDVGRSSGYNIEKWHWSYIPLSKIYLESYNKKVRLEDFKGFKGAQTAESIDVIKHYVNAINCL